VSSAAGINEGRGDTISVEPMPFNTDLKDQAEEAARLEQLRKDRILYTEIAAMILLAALLLGGFQMYRWRKRKERQAAIEAKLEAERLAQEEARKAEEEEQRRVAELEKKRIEAEQIEQRLAEAETRAAEMEKSGAGAVGASGLTPEEEENLTPEEKQRLVEKQAILKLIDEKPEEVAWLIKMWLIEDE
ncbi:MAG: hypothetical protein J5497_06590, partial [Selenomonadaceae bacterium]|nr:hypothetical protein [Selenomonadaceae bacterium]